MTTLDQARAAVHAALDDASVTTVEAAGALEPKDSGRLLVVVDDAVTTIRCLVAATNPRLAALTPDNDGEFSVHLIGTLWIAMSVATEESLAEGDEQPGEPGEAEQEFWARVDEAVDALTTTPITVDHRDVYTVLDLLVDWLAQSSPELGEQLRSHPRRNKLWDAANRALAGIKDAHIASMRRDARAWAEKVYAADPVPTRSTKPVYRDAAYRFMKKIDDHCTTRIAVEAIAIELETVAAERKNSLSF